MIGELKRLFKHSAVYGFSNILGKAVGFIMIPIYTRYIPPADYGLLELLDVTMNIVGMFVGLGIIASVARFYYLYKDETEKNHVISSSIIFLSSLLFCTVMVGYSLSDSFSRWLFQIEKYSYYIKLSFITFAFNAILEIPFTYIRAQERSAFFVIVSMLRLITSLSLNIFFVVAKGIGILGVLYSGVVTSVLFSVVMISWTIVKTGIGFNRIILWEMFKFGAPLIFNNIGMFIINWGDRYFIKAYASLNDLGVYSLGYKFGMMISFLIGQPFFMIWSFRRYNLIKEENGEETYGKIAFLYTIVLMYSWLWLSIFSFEIVSLVADKRYLRAYHLIPIIALGYVFREFSDYYKGIFYIEGKTFILGRLTIMGALFSLVAYVIFIPRWGSAGAAWATLSTFIFIAVANLVQANKVKYINYYLIKSGYCVGIAIASFICGYYLNRFNLQYVIAAKLLILVLFPIICFYFIFEKQERETIKILLSRKMKLRDFTG